MKTSLAAALALIVCGCSSSAGGYDFARLGVTATNANNETTPVGCTRLPVLVGSRALDRYDVAGQFTIVVSATTRGATISFEGVLDEQTLFRNVEAETLRSGYAEEIDVQSTDGGAIVVTLSSACAP